MFRWLWAAAHKTVYRSVYSYKTFFGFPFIPEGKGEEGEVKGRGGGGGGKVGVCVWIRRTPSFFHSSENSPLYLGRRVDATVCDVCLHWYVCVEWMKYTAIRLFHYMLLHREGLTGRGCLYFTGMNVFGTLSLWDPTWMHCVYIALWTRKILCGSFYEPYTFSFIIIKKNTDGYLTLVSHVCGNIAWVVAPGSIARA